VRELWREVVPQARPVAYATGHPRLVFTDRVKARPHGLPPHWLLMIVMMAGLPGTGKSTLARAVRRTPWRDGSRQGISFALVCFLRNRSNILQAGNYVVQLMLDEAEYVLRVQPARIIFLDGRPFSKKYQVDAGWTSPKALELPGVLSSVFVRRPSRCGG